jgi:hypothetical protein
MWKDIVDPATIKFTGYTLQAIVMGGDQEPIIMGGTNEPIVMGGGPTTPAAPMGQTPMTPQMVQARQQSNQVMAYTFKGTFQDKFQLGKIRLGRKMYKFTMNINAEDGNAIGASHD